VLTLRELHSESYILMSEVLDYGSKVGVIYNVPFHERDHRVDKANQSSRRFKCANCWRITSFGDHIETNRHYPDVVISPHRSLKLDTLLEVLD